MLHRSWFPLILAGSSLLLAAVFGVVMQRRTLPLSQQQVSTTAEAAPTQTQYQTAVQTILEAYKQNHDAQVAYDTLLLLKVPASMKDAHLDLVLAFTTVLTQGTDAAAPRFAALAANYSWLRL